MIEDQKPHHHTNSHMKTFTWCPLPPRTVPSPHTSHWTPSHMAAQTSLALKRQRRKLLHITSFHSSKRPSFISKACLLPHNSPWPLPTWLLRPDCLSKDKEGNCYHIFSHLQLSKLDLYHLSPPQTSLLNPLPHDCQYSNLIHISTLPQLPSLVSTITAFSSHHWISLITSCNL